MKNILKTILIFGSILFFSLSLSGQTWSARQRLTWNPGNSSYPRMAVTTDNQIHLVWHDYSFYKSEILYKNSTNRGDTWQAPTRITWTSGYSKLCDISGLDNSIYIVWSEQPLSNYDLMYKRGHSTTSTWDSPKRLTWSSGNSYFASICAITKTAMSTNYIIVHVVWEDNTSGNKEIYYKKGTYTLTKPIGTFGWSSQKRLTWNAGYSSGPKIAVDSNNHIHVFWYDNSSGNLEIYYKKSTDEGDNWSALHRLTWTSDYSTEHDVTIDSADKIHIVWYDGPSGNMSLYYKKSTDGGSTWSAPTRVMWNSADAPGTSIAVDSSDTLHVLYIDKHTGTDEVYYKKSTNGGLNWSAPEQLTWNSPGQNFNPNIIVDNSDGLHASWDGPLIFPGNTGYTHEIFYKNKK